MRHARRCRCLVVLVSTLAILVATVSASEASLALPGFLRRIGLPLTLMLGAMSVLLVPWLLPLYPAATG